MRWAAQSIEIMSLQGVLCATVAALVCGENIFLSTTTSFLRMCVESIKESAVFSTNVCLCCDESQPATAFFNKINPEEAQWLELGIL